MNRWAPHVVVVVAVAACAPAAPVPAEATREPLFPVLPGATWTYSSGDGDVVFGVASSETSPDGIVTVTLDRIKGPNGFIGGKFAISGSGVDEVSAFPFGAIRRPPVRCLRYPFRSDDQWETTTTVVGRKEATTWVARGPDRVKVPAGGYDAVRVESESAEVRDQERKPWKSTRWYAPGVGIVKWQDGRHTLELKEFKRGKN